MLPIKIRRTYRGFIKIAVTKLRIGLDESFSQRYRFRINSVMLSKGLLSALIISIAII